MRFEDLSPADQQLLNTDLGEIEKEAAEKIAIADEMYSVGFNKLAQQAADHLEAVYAAQEEKLASEVAVDEQSEKVASELGAFIERGFFDGLRKLGSDRYGDEMIYLVPFIEEKVAGEGAQKALAALKRFKGTVAEKAKGAKDAVVGKVKAHHAASQAHVEKGKEMVSKATGKMEKLKGYGKQVRGYGQHAAPYAGTATGLGLGAYGISKLKGKKKEESSEAGE